MQRYFIGVLLGFFIGSTVFAGTFDVDGNGSDDAFTDGLLIIRHFLGFTGAALTDGAIGTGAIHDDEQNIASYIDALGMELDIDGDGTPGAPTDGLLVMRYLLGFTGPALVDNGDGSPCSGCNASKILDYLTRVQNQSRIWQTNLTLVEVSAIDTDSIQVSWLPIDDGVTPGDQVSYRIYVSQTKDFLPDANTLKHSQAGIQSARIDGLTAGATYYVRMLASTSTGFTSQSRQFHILMPAQPPVRTAQTVVELPTGVVQSHTADSVTLASGATVPEVDDLISSRDPALLRRVTVVAGNPDGSTTLQTSAASLAEVYQSVQISSSIVLAAVPPTSPVAGAAYTQQGGPSRSIAPSGGATVHWPQSGLTLSNAEPTRLVSVAPASLLQNMRAQALQQVDTAGQGGALYSELYSETDDVYKQGNTLIITGPSAVAIVPGTIGGPSFTLKLMDTSRHELCSVKSLSIDSPNGKNGDYLVTMDSLIDKGNGEYALTLPIDATAAHVADSAYKVRFTAYVDDKGDDCSGDGWRLWKEKLTFEFDLFVVSSPNFPVNENTTLDYSDDFDVSNTVNFSFAPALEAEVILDGASLDYARLEAKADTMFDQELRIEAQAAGSIDQTKTLFKRQFTKVYMAGYVPIVMTGTLSTSVRIQGSVTGSMSVAETLHMGFDELAFGFEYRNGTYAPIKSIEPTYTLKIYGDADAEANLKISLLPAMTITFYEAATGKLVAEPYVTAEAGIHGQIHTDMTWDSITVDDDYWLTKGGLDGGLNLWLYANLHVWDVILLQWPDTANPHEYDTFHKVELIEPISILGLPYLSAEQWGYGHPDNSRALRFQGDHENVPNPFKSSFGVGPDAFITFTQWVPPKVIAANDQGYEVLDPISSSIAHDSWWIDFDRPGTYTVRMGGYNSLGGWARQVAADIALTLTDNDNDGMIDQWESEYGISDPNIDDDGDGLTNLQEFQQGRYPGVQDADQPPPVTYTWVTSNWDGCEGNCGDSAGTQTRFVSCETINGGIVVLDFYCDSASKPATNQSCTVQPPQCPATTTMPVNDTGITTCSDGATIGLTCAVTGYPGQDAQYGRDVSHNDNSDGHAGFSFTKIDANGNALPESATDWFCVQDNVTGLMWEVKTNDGGLHDKDDRYNWYNTDPKTNGGFDGYADDSGDICYGYRPSESETYCNTQAYMARVNAAGWCGQHDWRMPTKVELRSIVSLDRSNPAIDSAWFRNAMSAQYWSASPYARYTNKAWYVNFNNGVSLNNVKGNYYVRLVRGGQ